MNTEIEDLKIKLKVLRKYRKLKVYSEELKKLSRSAARKYCQNNSAELTEYGQIRSQVLELYPSGHIPTAENLEQKTNALIQERSEKDLQFREADKRAHDLADAQRTIEVSHLSRILENALYVHTDKEVYRYFLAKGYEMLDDMENYDGVHGLFVHANNDGSHFVKVAYHEGLVPADVWLIVQDRKAHQGKRLCCAVPLSKRNSQVALFFLKNT